MDKEERFIELCREKEVEIWTEMQDGDWANEEIIYPHLADPNQMLSEIFAIVATVKCDESKELMENAFINISNKIACEIEKVAEFQVRQRLE